jgi:adenosylhomocysteine nucleosidase/futalosine hydrolase
MEGAALFAAAESLGLRVAEIRAISNRVGEPFAEWGVEEALEALAEVLSNIEKEL